MDLPAAIPNAAAPPAAVPLTDAGPAIVVPAAAVPAAAVEAQERIAAKQRTSLYGGGRLADTLSADT